MGYAVSLKAQAQFISDNIGNQQKIEPYLMQIHSMLYAADRLGLSSLNEFKNVLRCCLQKTAYRTHLVESELEKVTLWLLLGIQISQRSV